MKKRAKGNSYADSTGSVDMFVSHILCAAENKRRFLIRQLINREIPCAVWRFENEELDRYMRPYTQNEQNQGRENETTN